MLVAATRMVRVPSAKEKLTDHATFAQLAAAEERRMNAEEQLKRQTDALLSQMYVIGDVRMPPPTPLQSLPSWCGEFLSCNFF